MDYAETVFGTTLGRELEERKHRLVSILGILKLLSQMDQKNESKM